jgi:hypothetical protein
MTRRQIETQERRLARLARGETRIHERLLGLRGELDILIHQLDRIVIARPPRLRVGAPDLAAILSLARYRRGRP